MGAGRLQARQGESPWSYSSPRSARIEHYNTRMNDLYRISLLRRKVHLRQCEPERKAGRGGGSRPPRGFRFRLQGRE